MLGPTDQTETTPSDAAAPAQPAAARSVLHAERADLLHHLTEMLEPLMVGLGLVFLVLLLVDLSGVKLRPDEERWLNRVLIAIWIAFIADFALRFVVAPSKRRFLRANWLDALSLFLPFLRPLRALRALQTLRSLSMVQLVGGMNRGMRGLRRLTRGRQLVYVAVSTLLMTLASAIGVLYFDRGVADAPIQTLGAALWWAIGIITTIGNEEYPVSGAARLIGVILSLYAISVVGYVTASIASWLIGRDAAQPEPASASPAATADSPSDLAALRAEVAALRDDLAHLRQDLAARDGSSRVRGAPERDDRTAP